MISLIYWIITILVSLYFESWTCFIVMAAIWIIWMLIRALAKNGVGSDGDSWWFFDDFDSGSGDSDFDFGDGDFGGGGDGGDW
jgi:hypothetical protein